MKWGRDVYKIIPVSLYDIPGLESWLEDQADLGLFPLRLSSYARFSGKGVPGTRSLLAPVWYTVSEEVYALDSEIDNRFSPEREAGFRYAPRMEMVRLRLLIPAMARPVAEAALDKLRLVNLWWEYEEAAHPGLDFVILARDSSGVHQMAALARGGRVAVFRYGGVENLADHLETLSAMVR